MTDGVHGHVLADPNDTEALATAIHDIISPQRRAALREACLELRPRLSYEHHLDQLEAIYSRAMSSRAPS
jgi:glycosyltransferase involved in cell wall biosynthesis